MAMPKGSGQTPAVTPEGEALRHLETLLRTQKWTEAKIAARELATQHPHTAHYRALLALARGHEAAVANDPQRAREEWRRALTLEPTLEAAKIALASRAGRRSWVERLFRR